MKDRAKSAYEFRVAAAETARHRLHPSHLANGDEERYASACYPMSFTKGLEHSSALGLVDQRGDFEALRSAIDNGFVEPFTTRVPVPKPPGKGERRQWEAPTAGVVFEIQGPDPQAVTMPPAPELGSSELDFEMAEVYELSLLRDVPLSAFDAHGGSGVAPLDQAIGRLNALEYAQDAFPGRPRKADGNQALDRQTVFRGSSPGVEAGPYLSQFMLIGTQDQAGQTMPEDGFVTYGGQTVDQRVLEAEQTDDYMMKWNDWRAVQRGFRVQGKGPGQAFTGKRRFIATPRDLATYVHFDALYQAYLNACLILLANGTPFDPAFDLLSGSDGHEFLVDSASGSRMSANAGGFALWGGPHILSLVTEVATRGLKAVRFQKFNNHLRLRPEALAGRLEKAAQIDQEFPATCGRFGAMATALGDTIKAIETHNRAHVRGGSRTALLPMAFQEGSPMHPTYGAGHATVAGACVTILKAFFDTSAVFAKVKGVAGFYGKQHLADASAKDVVYGAFEANKTGTELVFTEFETPGSPAKKGAGKAAKAKKVESCPLTLEGELNKLAANISIGRNMAGVHFFSDYYDSARMGEQIALGILEEQALGYATDPFVMSVPKFDGETVRVGRR